MTSTVTRTVRRSLAATATTLALLALAGCGGDDPSSAGSDETSGSASASPSESASESASESTSPSASDEETGSATAATGSEVSAEEFGSVVRKALDQATTADVTISSSSAGLEGTGQIDFKADPQALKMTATVAQMGDIEVVLVDKTFYLKSALLGSDKWIKLAIDDPNSPLGALGDQLDPTASLENLVDGIQTATYVGTEDVDGESLEHYTATIDTAAILKDLPAEAQGQAQLPKTVEYQWWFDGDGNIRKYSGDLGGATGVIEGTFDNWGTKVDISAPPASQVTPLPGM